MVDRAEIPRFSTGTGLSSRGGERTVEPTGPTSAARRETTTYRVVEGDTVSTIAERFGVSVQTIVSANGLSNAELLSPGQELKILPISGTQHTVTEGETLLSLAESHGVIPEDIAAVNGLAEPYLLQIGQVLLIPEVSAARAAPVAPQSTGQVLKPGAYEVASGDTLSDIASRLGLRTETLRWANPSLANADALAPGDKLIVPPVDGVLHRVADGDTLSSVAGRYGASAAEIATANGIGEPYLLSIGQTLVVPGGVPPRAPEPVKTAAPTPASAKPASAPQLAPTSRPAPTPTPRPAPQPAPAPKPAPQPAPAPATSDRAGVVQTALKYRGYRYTWGGTSPATGFDCSGFVWYVYNQSGVPLPRDLWGQYNSGRRVSRDELQPGDIVFFQNTYQPGLSHDGVYIGGGQFIQAASENTGVIVTSLSEPYWAARYLGATRP